MNNSITRPEPPASAPCSFLSAATGVLLLMFLSACSVGPDFHPPDTELQTTFNQAGHSGFSTDSIERHWWRLFDDPQLIHLIEQATQHNYDLKTARASLLEARALFLEAGLNLVPTITAQGSYNEQKRSAASLNNRAFVPRELKLYSAGFDALWELDLFGRVRRDVEASNAEVEAQQASLQDLIVSVRAEVARNYFELRGLQHQLDVAKKNVAIQTETLDITHRRVASGRGTEFDTLRVMSRLQTTQAAIPPLESTIQRAVHRLSVLTGQVPGALGQTLSQAKPLPRIPKTIRIGTPTDLLRRRPDIRVAEQTLAASTSRIGVATADLFPRVSFVGSIALEATTFSGLGSAGSDSYSVGPRISWAAFDLGRVYARIKAANAHAEADLARFQQTVLNALEETENALVNYNREQARYQWLAAAVSADRKAHELALMRYQAGVDDFLTVLDAEARLLEDQNSLAQSKTAVATALTALYKALGGGWE